MKDSTEGGCAERAIADTPNAGTSARPVHRVGDEVVFKYEGNLRARVEGYGVVDGRVWLELRARYGFLVPPSHVVGVEGEDWP